VCGSRGELEEGVDCMEILREFWPQKCSFPLSHIPLILIPADNIARQVAKNFDL